MPLWTTYTNVSIIVLKKVPFLITLKRMWFIQPIKRTAKRKNQTVDQLELCLIYLNFKSDFYMTKCILILVTFSLNVAFVSDIVRKTASQQWLKNVGSPKNKQRMLCGLYWSHKSISLSFARHPNCKVTCLWFSF